MNHLLMQIVLALHSLHIMLCLSSITREIKQQHKKDLDYFKEFIKRQTLTSHTFSFKILCFELTTLHVFQHWNEHRYIYTDTETPCF